ncbi:tetratricopeptide (TPR) repeat protein [Caulobacter ginsengisoli]|uniref:Tetratricopeptide (TPR) repeat protein n=1 Tax=Caulobacter ginsengisoli TaxID=400775 RepID=A0ABU0IL97_9CAUL|nr:putative 2OG-Fe(II) oxygenase [Caulobacter ginsengisoli]MDQ0462789.1 tetratricopeptide (TPR) repeat protein [Caulobacter ginsengisoli]
MSAADDAIAQARALGGKGDLVSAEAVIRAALATQKKSAQLQTELAQIAAAQGRDDEAEKALRAALDADPLYPPAAYSLTQGLIGMGRVEEALAVITPLAEVAKPESAALALQGQALRALGRTEAALDALYTATRIDQADPSHQHNLALALEEAGLHPEATRAARAARARGLDRPETWLIEGRTLLAQDRLDEAETAFREALRRQPNFTPAHRELSLLTWMRSGDLAAATSELDKAIAASPGQPGLRVVRAKLLEYTGDARGAYECLREAPQGESEIEIQMAASQAAVAFDPAAALAHAETAVRLEPDHPLAISLLAEANLALGRPEAILAATDRLRALLPFNQHALALEATAWRLLGDPRNAQRNDYQSLVRTALVETPAGWSSREAWLADLTAALDRLQVMKGHPVGQSLRGGSQTNQNLQRSTDPAIRAFFQVIADPIMATMEAYGRLGDPVLSRNTGRYRLAGAWSVNLRPGGHHVDHLHPAGWLSSAFYVDLPPAVEGEGREGWLRFGKPGIASTPALEAEHWVKPEPGMLVLFPSYMWHGTQPFGGEARRLTMAFDVMPA